MTDTSKIKNDFDRISFTGYMTAYWRSLSDIPFAKDISKALGAEAVTREFLGKHFEPMTWFGEVMVEARNKALKREIHRLGSKNIYGIAEGVLPTGIEMTADPQVKYVHSDLPGMLSEAEAVLRDIMVRKRLRRPNLRFLAVNALSREELKTGVDYFGGEEFDIVHEGFFIYMRPENGERRDVADNFLDGMVRNRGRRWITTDINYRKNVLSIEEALGPKYAASLRECLMMIKERTGGRNMRENFFEDPEEAHGFLDEVGFDFERYPFIDGSFELTSLRHVPKKMRQGFLDIFKNRYVYVMTPQAHRN